MKEQKVDKGFELQYYKLSYRRRFIRTLWLIPWMFLALFLMNWVGANVYILVAVAIIFAITGYIQARHNYKKWKEEEAYTNDLKNG